MKKTTTTVLLVAAALAGLGLLATRFLSDREKGVAAAEVIPRPVTVTRLMTIDPTPSLMLTGEVTPWKDESLSFEVTGRIAWIIEKGAEVAGARTHPDGSESPGTIVARLDPTRYELSLKSTEARIAAMEAQADALRLTIDEVMARTLDATEVDLNNKRQRYDRLVAARERSGASVSRQALDDAETEYRRAEAQKAELQAQIVSRRAEHKAILAQVDELREMARDASLDIEKCVLRTPWSGRIAEIDLNVGANVKPGTPVARIVVMNPMMIGLEVSAEVDRKLAFRDIAEAYLPGSKVPVPAMVYTKSTIADPHTHTFSLDLLVKNEKAFTRGKLSEELLALPRIEGATIAVLANNLSVETGPEDLVTESKAFCTDDDGTFLWHITESRSPQAGAQVHRLKKVHLEGEGSMRGGVGLFPGTIFKQSEVSPGDRIAVGVPGGVASGDEVADYPLHWRFRPGDLVKVLLPQQPPPVGHYVPADAVGHQSGESYVLRLVENGHGFSRTVESIAVTVHNRVGGHLRITGADLTDGDEIVLTGIHFLRSGDEVIVKSRVEIEL